MGDMGDILFERELWCVCVCWGGGRLGEVQQDGE